MPLQMREREMRVTRNKWWTELQKPIIGFDESTPGSGAEGEGAIEGAGTGQEGPGESQGSEGQPVEGQGAVDDAAGLKSALQKERADRKALEKELKAYRKSKEDQELAEKSEVERVTTQAQRAEEKAAKLAAGFRKNAIHSAVIAAAGKAKFLDPTDALRPEVLEAIQVEQDEDDPSLVTIDEKSVTAAVAALAKSKKHYVTASQEQQQKQKQLPRSGSGFGGGAPTSNLTADEQVLAARYPALRGLR